MRKSLSSKGFTLIELLVVISIIALLLAILMPTLAKVKELGKRVVCLSNQRQLSLAWRVYGQSDDGQICSPCPGWTGEDLKYSWIAWTGSGHPSTWTEQQCIDSMQQGALWDYCENEGIYRCPAGEREEKITYAGFASMGWIEKLNRPSDGEIYYKLSQIPRPSTRAVFIDEGSLTPHFYSVYYNVEQWWDQPPNRHSEGVTMSFADAHAEYWGWKDVRTKEMCRLSWDEFSGTYNHVDCLDNKDLTKLRQAAWGNLPK